MLMRFSCCFSLSLLFIVVSFISSAQTSVVDSLVKIASKEKSDTARLHAMLRLAKSEEDINLDDAKLLYDKIILLSAQLRAKDEMFAAWIHKASLFLQTNQWDSSFAACDKADALAAILKKSNLAAEAYIQRGDIYQRINDFPAALKLYQKAEPLLDRSLQAKHASRFVDLYDRIDNIKASREYGYKAIRLAAEIGDSSIWVYTHHVMFSSKQDSLLSKGFVLLRRALPVAIRNHYTQHIIQIYHNLGIYYFFNDKYDSAIHSATMSASYMKKPFDTDSNLASNRVLMGNCYLYRADVEKEASQTAAFRKDVDTSIRLAREGILYAQRGKITTYLRAGYRELSQALGLGDYYKEAVKIYMKYIDLNDSITSLRNAEQTDRMEARYQNEKKQLQIKELELIKSRQEGEIHARNVLIVVGAVVLVLAAFSTLLLIRNIHAKQKLSEQRDALQQQKIVELQKDKEIVLANAVVKSQEEERSRIAKDLHDGVGGMLSGIKLTLNTMKGNVMMSQEQAQVFERSLDMIDHSIKELRHVSHNLMPETLVKFGLSAALKDFSDFINQSNAIKAIFQQVGTERRLDANAELLIYRIVNELINNALKHANASEIIIQIHFESQMLTLTIEDNGKGFDKEILKVSKGLGWANIKSRVDYLGGTLDVNTSPGQGTAISITIPL
jgi:two-component system NarL family sensor kinase